MNAIFCGEYYNCPTAVKVPMSVLFLWQLCAFREIDTSEKNYLCPTNCGVRMKVSFEHFYVSQKGWDFD